MYNYYGYARGIDWSSLLYFLGIVVALISLFFSAKVSSTYKRISKDANSRGISGQEAAYRILAQNGLSSIPILPISGTLTDNYNPTNRSLNLSQSVYGGRDIASVAVAAHECGHAIQHATEYKPLLLRSRLVPAANLGSNAGIVLFMIGLLLNIGNSTFLMDLGIFLFSISVLFHVVTLGVEFDASRRGLQALTASGILYEEEMPKARKMLRVAAYTYLAAMSSAVIQLLRLVAIRNSRNDRR